MIVFSHCSFCFGPWITGSPLRLREAVGDQECHKGLNKASTGQGRRSPVRCVEPSSEDSAVAQRSEDKEMPHMVWLVTPGPRVLAIFFFSKKMRSNSHTIKFTFLKHGIESF